MAQTKTRTMSRAALNAQLFNQAVALGLNPNFTGKPGKGRRTNYLQSLIASYRPPTPEPPPPPPPVQPIQAPLEVQGDNRSRLTSQSRTRKRRSKAQRGKRALTTGLNTGAVTGGSTGGVSF
jgi:hypothetical protein